MTLGEFEQELKKVMDEAHLEKFKEKQKYEILFDRVNNQAVFRIEALE